MMTKEEGRIKAGGQIRVNDEQKIKAEVAALSNNV